MKQADGKSTPVYVGEINYFSETGEFYTSLYFNLEYEGTDDAILPQLDSLIYKGRERTRRRLPMDFAKKIFMLSGLDSVFIYNARHDFVSKATLERIEYLEGKSEDKFVAVYKTGKVQADQGTQLYCISNNLKELYVPGFSSSAVNNPSLNNFLLYRIKADPNLHWQIKNIQIHPHDATYSILTSFQESYITELKDNQFMILKNLTGKYRIENILPLPFMVNNRPLILSTLYIPGQLPRSISLEAFTDFQEYRIQKYNRLTLKNR